MAAADGRASLGKKKAIKSGSVGRKSLPRKASELSKEELLLTLQKKRECNARALKIVESLLESSINEERFLGVLQHINQSHLGDVIEERAILKLCGYPICSNVLKNVPSQQYCISSKQNKVYDITERKLFCSNRCFRACRFIKDQMLTSPLWLRDIEPNINFKLMPFSEIRCGAGDEVDFDSDRVTKSDLNRIKTTLSDDTKSESLKLEFERPTLSNEIDNVISSKINKLEMMCSFSGNESASSLNLSLLNPLQRNTVQCFPGKDTGEGNNSDVLHVCRKDETCDSNIERPLKTHENSSYSKVPIQEVVDSCEVLEVNAKDVSQEFGSIAENSHHCDAQSEQKLQSTDAQKISDKDDTSNSKHFIALLNSDTEAVGFDHKSPSKYNVDLPSNFVKKKFLPAADDSPNKPDYPFKDDLCKEIGHETLKAAPKLPFQDEKVPLREHRFAGSLSGKEHTSEDFRLKLKKPSNSVCLTKKGRNSSLDVLPFILNVEKSFKEWFTIETMSFLYGENALKEMLEVKGESIMKHYKGLGSATWDSAKHEIFLAICKRLSLVELEDNNFDDKIKKGENDVVRKPLPDYNALKEESEFLNLQVQAFFKGKMESREKKVTFAENSTDNLEDATKSNEKQLQVPLLHLHSQRALRKKIVLDGLNRVLPDFFRTLGLRSGEMTSSVRGLVSTFSLSPSNITFKPQEWSLVGLIIIKLLSVRELQIRKCLESEQSCTYLTLMLMSYKLEPAYLDTLLIWLTDIDQLLSKN